MIFKKTFQSQPGTIINKRLSKYSPNLVQKVQLILDLWSSMNQKKVWLMLFTF